MQISFDLKELNQIIEHLTYAISVAEIIADDANQQLQNAQLMQSPDISIIQQQGVFIKDECRYLRDRKKLLAETYELFYESKRSSSEKITDAAERLQALQNF